MLSSCLSLLSRALVNCVLLYTKNSRFRQRRQEGFYPKCRFLMPFWGALVISMFIFRGSFDIIFSAWDLSSSFCDTSLL